MSKKRININGRIYERMSMWTFDEEGRKSALKDAQAWRDRRYWATVKKVTETTYTSYPMTETGPLWAVYKSIKKKGK
jgi:hypothetical protein